MYSFTHSINIWYNCCLENFTWESHQVYLSDSVKILMILFDLYTQDYSEKLDSEKPRNIEQLVWPTNTKHTLNCFQNKCYIENVTWIVLFPSLFKNTHTF